ncbi:TIGR02281 family clan AA aspartic protease [Pararhizobium sp.]|uniref:TIGR02281 family clan AA aspartic protease n=1 Tax=Pararhizobium sp. TaxID=1977563 RepID=UPI00272195EB|nr:TIGR02281 family clan AA aspartic protease [Pararhizobium sp.]MDO9417847.1 TIGR02281 family clan AA aspartic protease [Pararhizobium sp.]
MLVRILVIAGGVAAAALFIPGIASTYLDRTDNPVSENRKTTPVAVNTAKYAGGKGTRLTADERGHFFGDFRINGRKERGLVDTGATMIAISEATARRLGISSAKLDFRYEIDTANGKSRAAYVVLDKVEIGTVVAHDVDAMVLRNGTLTTTLVGMSFLKTLSSYQVADGKLLLVK